MAPLQCSSRSRNVGGLHGQRIKSRVAAGSLHFLQLFFLAGCGVAMRKMILILLAITLSAQTNSQLDKAEDTLYEIRDRIATDHLKIDLMLKYIIESVERHPEDLAIASEFGKKLVLIDDTMNIRIAKHKAAKK